MKIKNTLITVFILFHFLVMARSILPLEYSFFSNLYRPIDSYLSFFSIYQDWMMFAPNPSREEIFFRAIIEFNDKSKVSFSFTEESDHFWSGRLKREKIRKLMSSLAVNEKNLESLARFALRKVGKSNYRKIPLKVFLYKDSYITPDLEDKFISYNNHKNLSATELIYTYEVM